MLGNSFRLKMHKMKTIKTKSGTKPGLMFKYPHQCCKEATQEQAKKNSNDLKLAYQCIKYRGVSECFNKSCLNMMCPLNMKQKYLKYIK